MWKELALILFLVAGAGAFAQERGEGREKGEPVETTSLRKVDSLKTAGDSLGAAMESTHPMRDSVPRNDKRQGQTKNMKLDSTFGAQNSTEEKHPKYMIIEGDTVPREFIGLEEVVILERLKFDNLEQRRRYLILKRRTHKVFPYAQLASERLVELNSRLDKIESKRDQKRYIKIVQDYIEGEFKEELKKLTRSEGQILVKLVHRQTGKTTFDLIKDLRSGWNAFWYNTTASLFDISLKEEYYPQEVEEDYLIEDILQRAFQARELEPQPSVLDFDYLELTDKWSRKNTPSQAVNRS